MVKETHCFWCEIPTTELSKKDVTRDHLVPLGMGGNDGKTVIACRKCNEERGAVTEIYNHRLQLIKWINLNPDRITSYKNKFRKKIQKMASLIIKWEQLHRQMNIILPFNLFEIIKLDELTPIGFG
jgi:hypothetical protein